MTGDVTLHTRVNGRRRSPERNYGELWNFRSCYHYGDVTTGIVVLLIKDDGTGNGTAGIKE